jgi:hypothetical protein
MGIRRIKRNDSNLIEKSRSDKRVPGALSQTEHRQGWLCYKSRAEALLLNCGMAT